MNAIKSLLLLICALSIFTVCDTPLGLEITTFDLVKPDVCRTTGECTYKIQLESEGFPITGDIINQISNNYDIVFDWDNGLGLKNILSKAIEEGFCRIVGNTIQFTNQFEKSGEYNVTVTLNNRNNGESSSGQFLHPVSLIIKKYTLYFDVKAEDGEGTFFYTYQADSYEDAERMLENFGQEYLNEKILKGTPGEIADNYLYPFMNEPICGRILDGESKTFSSFHLLRLAVLRLAEIDGKAYGYYKMNPCSYKYTLYFDVKDENSQGTYFYAYETKSYEDAKRILSTYQGKFSNETILEGNCKQNADNYIYPMIFAPVCGRVLHGERTTFSSFYKLRIEVLYQAHRDGKAYGFYTPGECQLVCGGIAGFTCPKGYECVIEETYPDAMGHCVKKD